MNDEHAKKVVEQLIFTTNNLKAQADETARVANAVTAVAHRLDTQNQLLAKLVKQLDLGQPRGGQ